MTIDKQLVGGYQIEDTVYSLYNRPSWFHRFLMGILLNAVWVDYEN
jgi:hypothetical protein